VPVNKRKKNSRQRGSWTHGWGAKKKHRGSGNRGGRGMAGSGKRADQKKPTILKLYGNEYFGRHGFNRTKFINKNLKTINVGELQEMLDDFSAKKHAKKTSDGYFVDLAGLGYSKLLGSGIVNIKLEINVDSASKNAAMKIENAGGKIVKKNGQ